MLEQRLSEQQTGVIPSMQCINLMEEPPIDTVLDLEQPTAPSSLSDSNSDTRPNALGRTPPEMITPNLLDLPLPIYISDLLRVDLYATQPGSI